LTGLAPSAAARVVVAGRAAVPGRVGCHEIAESSRGTPAGSGTRCQGVAAGSGRARIAADVFGIAHHGGGSRPADCRRHGPGRARHVALAIDCAVTKGEAIGNGAADVRAQTDVSGHTFVVLLRRRRQVDGAGTARSDASPPGAHRAAVTRQGTFLAAPVAGTALANGIAWIAGLGLTVGLGLNRGDAGVGIAVALVISGNKIRLRATQKECKCGEGKISGRFAHVLGSR